MYQMIRKSGIGEWAEPIYYRQVIAHFYIQLSVEYELRPCRELTRTSQEQ